MKYLFTLFIVCYYIPLHSQGLEVLSPKDYKKLPSPSILSGAGDLERRYVIPDIYFPTPGNQGGAWSCTGWAVGYYLDSYYQGRLTNTPPDLNPKIFSHAYVYDILRRCKNHGCNCGINIPNALDYIQINGNVPLTAYNDDCGIPDLQKLKDIAIKYKIKHWVTTQTSNLNDLKSYILDDIPVIVSIGVDNDFQNFKHKTENDIYDIKVLPFDQYLKHCVLLTGYDEDKKAFRIINSYGTEWGSKGFAWISYNAFRQMFVVTGQQAYVITRDFNDDAPGAPNDSAFLQNKKDTSNFTNVLVKAIKDSSSTSNAYILNSTILSDEKISVKNDKVKKSQLNANYLIKKEDTTSINISAHFHPYTFQETIKKDKYYITSGFKIDSAILHKVLNITYIYNDPTFIRNKSTSYKRPNFEDSYYGQGCLINMTAVIHFTDGSSFPITFNSCKLIEAPLVVKDFVDKVSNITPTVTADYINKNRYNFRVQLRGITDLKDLIREVVYDRNDPTFKERFQVIKDKNTNFESTYIGWGCLDHLLITIYFKDNSTKVIDFNMCKQLGWD